MRPPETVAESIFLSLTGGLGKRHLKQRSWEEYLKVKIKDKNKKYLQVKMEGKKVSHCREFNFDLELREEYYPPADK